MSTMNDDVWSRKYEQSREMVNLANCCRVPSQSSWVLSAFKFSICSPPYTDRGARYIPPPSCSPFGAWSANTGLHLRRPIMSTRVTSELKRSDDISNTLAAYNRNSRGPMTDPCGTPYISSKTEDRNDLIHARAAPPRPNMDCTLDSRISWSTQSKAALRSKGPVE